MRGAFKIIDIILGEFCCDWFPSWSKLHCLNWRVLKASQVTRQLTSLLYVWPDSHCSDWDANERRGVCLLQVRLLHQVRACDSEGPLKRPKKRPNKTSSLHCFAPRLHIMESSIWQYAIAWSPNLHLFYFWGLLRTHPPHTDTLPSPEQEHHLLPNSPPPFSKNINIQMLACSKYCKSMILLQMILLPGAATK